LHIYQEVFLLTPRHVTDHIATLLRDFLWQVRKGNDKKMHLVNWDIAKRLIAEVRLQIRDPSLVKKALGSKLLWKMIHDPTHPVSIISQSKYADNNALSKMQLQTSASCSQVWRLCCKSSDFLKKLMYRIPSNGKRTHLWKYRIMGSDPLEKREEIVDLRNWLERAGVNSVYDLEIWHNRGDWARWDFHGVPAHLRDQLILLEDLLEDATPVNKKDRWGWGQTGVYTSAEGYRALQGSKNSNQTPTFSKQVQEPLALPKVNFIFLDLGT